MRSLHRRQSLPAELDTIAPPQAEAEPEAEGGGQDDLRGAAPVHDVQRRGRGVHASGGVSAISADELRSQGGDIIRLGGLPYMTST